MKKFVLLFLCMLMITVNGYAYYDINNKDLETKVEELSEFNIINGYDDGLFKPDNPITRAEFCKIIVNTVFADTSEAYERCFTDMSDTHWAKDYIYIAKNLGIVNGVNDTTFSPDSNITYEQAIKMIVAALGYEESAENKGGYPNGYISVANSLGITSGVSYSNTNKATRGNIALMIYNALNAKYYDIWNNNGIIEKKLSDTTLYERHKFIQEIQENGDISSDVSDNTEEAVG